MGGGGVAPRADGVGGGGGGAATVRWGRGGGNSALGVGGAIVGGQQWRGLQTLRTALHTISTSLQNNLS